MSSDAVGVEFLFNNELGLKLLGGESFESTRTIDGRGDSGSRGGELVELGVKHQRPPPPQPPSSLRPLPAPLQVGDSPGGNNWDSSLSLVRFLTRSGLNDNDDVGGGGDGDIIPGLLIDQELDKRSRL